MKERMAQSRGMTPNEEKEESSREMPIETTLASMNSEMVDHLDNAQMRTLLKQAVDYFQSDKD